MRRTEHQVLESEASAPRARAVFKITCPRRQISPPVRKALPYSAADCGWE